MNKYVVINISVYNEEKYNNLSLISFAVMLCLTTFFLSYSINEMDLDIHMFSKRRL